MKRVAILGSTGSIGRQALEVAAEHPDLLKIVGLAAGSNAALLKEQAEKFGVEQTALFHDSEGIAGVTRVAVESGADIVLVAVAGVIGLGPAIAAIQAGKDIALASKEVLVAAGEIVIPLVQKQGIRMIPVDSEHSAIFQCLQGYPHDQVDQLILTASGGPFRGRSAESLAHVTVEEALRHPNWTMGGKITIDSATLMNKGLEMIEAKWLFGLPMSQIEVVVHPQSIVHSFVKFRDGSVLGQFGWPDMRLPIQIALLHPEKAVASFPEWNPVESPNLTFEPLDETTFMGPRLARLAEKQAGTMPCVFNAANEQAVASFLKGELGFLDICRIVEDVMASHKPVECTLENILESDHWARKQVLRETVTCEKVSQ